MALPPQAPAPVPNTWVPHVLTVDGPYGYYVDKVYTIYVYAKAILSDSLDYLGSPGGQKTLLIKFPEAIVRISKRIGLPTSIPSKILSDVANLLKPLNVLGPCANTFVAIAEVGTKFKPMFKWPELEKQYVVIDQNNNPCKAQLPVDIWWQWSGVVQNVADWTISVSQCEAYLRKDSAQTIPLATWGARYLSVKNLGFEVWFLYQTLWLGNPWRYEEVQRNGITVRGEYKPLNAIIPNLQSTTLAKREIAGSLLKISLSVVCLSLDFFKKLNGNEKKPFWLEAAIFWTGIAPTFITPVAMRYWPNLVTKPLYRRAT